ncbi:uncharacterized protein LOC134188089 [Corticium candelabrum]|uniref:uncharacterized protein LOC134188089 n=1 Tax=Corticium candelabrum TaxID=121492 RepID=UPI002E270EF9|nr:uncharacterized protein LOC134188089 [Corticium candelabrum]
MESAKACFQDILLFLDHVSSAGETIADIMSELSPEQAVAQMRFTELQHMLNSCRETAQTARKQFERLASLGTGELAREARQQIENDSLDSQLVQVMVRHARQRLSDIKATKERLAGLGAAGGMSVAMVYAESLLGKGQQAQMLVKGAFLVGIVSGVAMIALFIPGVRCFFPLIGKGIVSPAAVQVVLGFLSAGGFAISDALEEKVEKLVDQLKQLAGGFQELHKNLSKVTQEIAILVEKTETCKGDMALLQPEPSATRNKYESMGVIEAMRSFLDDLEQLKPKADATDD